VPKELYKSSIDQYLGSAMKEDSQVKDEDFDKKEINSIED
jgi:hypothetical protein